jgi:hypothetical protein
MTSTTTISRYFCGIIPALILTSAPSYAQVLYTQSPITNVASPITNGASPITNGASLIQSAWFAPDGPDSYVYTWDSFRLPSTSSITEIDWRGGTTQTTNFNVAIYASIAGGSQPNVTTPDTTGNTALVSYNALAFSGTPAGVFNGITMYDYNFALPTSFTAQGDTTYWLRILADDGTWGIASATDGNGSDFRYLTGLSMFLSSPGDTVFTLKGVAIPEPSTSLFLLAVVGALPFHKRFYRK